MSYILVNVAANIDVTRDRLECRETVDIRKLGVVGDLEGSVGGTVDEGQLGERKVGHGRVVIYNQSANPGSIGSGVGGQHVPE